jgi:hypothetical protein
MRLFACAALVRMAPDHREYVDGECQTVAQMIASAVVLGPPVARAAASVLTWRYLAWPGFEENAAFLAFGILLLAVHLEQSEERAQWLNELAEWVQAEEARARLVAPRCEPWLLGLTNFNMRHEVWSALALRILARPERPHPEAARESLQLLGELVAGI